jgi:hypothetical protein
MYRRVFLRLIAPKLSARRLETDIGPGSLIAKFPTIVLWFMVQNCHQKQT